MPELSRHDADELEREIHERHIANIVEATNRWFDTNRPAILALLVEATVTALDQWSRERSQKWLARLGLASLAATVAAGLTYMGWKGWGGK